MKRVHYQVTGLQNNTEKTQLKNALDKIEGVSMVNVDIGRGSIEVGFNEETNEDEIRKCIEDTNCISGITDFNLDG